MTRLAGDGVSPAFRVHSAEGTMQEEEPGAHEHMAVKKPLHEGPGFQPVRRGPCIRREPVSTPDRLTSEAHLPGDCDTYSHSGFLVGCVCSKVCSS